MRCCNLLRARVDQNCAPLKRILDDDVVVVVAAVELHGDGSCWNADARQHGSKKDDVIVAVTVGKTLLADGVEEDERGLNELPTIRIG